MTEMHGSRTFQQCTPAADIHVRTDLGRITTQRPVLLPLLIARFGQGFLRPSLAFSYMRMHTLTHMHIGTRTSTCTLTCTPGHTYIHTYMHTYMHACMHACIHTYIHAQTYIYIFYRHIYMSVCLSACLPACLPACLSVCM